jgi:hypothetical protein
MRYLSVFVFLAAFGATVVAEEKTATDARRAVEGYVAAALTGKVDDAAALAVADQSPAKKKRIEEFQQQLGVKALKVVTVLASAKKGQAIAVSEKVKIIKPNPDGRDTGVLSFKLLKMKDKWLVKDIDFGTEEKAKGKVKEFGKKNPDAKEVPAKSK